MAEDLDRTLADTREKTRALDESLKSLSDGGLEALGRAVSGIAATVRTIPRPRAPEAIAAQELSALLRRELIAGIAAAIGRPAALTPANGGGFNVTIHNNSGAQVTAVQTTDGFDRRALEITIDQMVASSLARGAETTGILRSLFGLVPTLIGR
jgi:hypothetical protein